MCYRYWVDKSPELLPFIEEMNRSPLVERFLKTGPVTSEGEIRPTDVAPVIASNKRGQRTVYPMKWGFSGRTLLVNARMETAAVKPTFSEAWRMHRCIVPASGYFEWEHLVSNDGRKKTGPKYLIQPKGSAAAWMCGLYRIEASLPVFVILTREPGEEIRFIHDRMPLILPGEYVEEWIRPGAKPEELAEAALTQMVYKKVADRPAGAEGQMRLP